MTLPSNEHVFELNEIGETTLKEYKGQFTSLCVLSMLHKQMVGIEKTKLQADFSNPDIELKGIAHILAHLRVRLVDGPTWWQQSEGGYTIQDENVILALYNSVMKGEDLWRKKVEEAAKKAEKEAQKSDHVPSAKSVDPSTS